MQSHQILPIAVDPMIRSIAAISISVFPCFSSFSRTARTSIGGLRPSLSARYHRFMRGTPIQGYHMISLICLDNEDSETTVNKVDGLTPYCELTSKYLNTFSGRPNSSWCTRLANRASSTPFQYRLI